MNDRIKGHHLIIGAALLALFLAALDALVMSAAMPTIVADLGGFAFIQPGIFRTAALPCGVASDIREIGRSLQHKNPFSGFHCHVSL